MLGGIEWTDERIEVLKSMSAQGLSAGQIAEKLGGVSRNAVIGKLHRLQRGERSRPSRPARPHKALARVPAPVRPAESREEVFRPMVAPPTPPPMDREPGDPVGVSFLALQEHMCRWPIGDPSSTSFGFCGDRIGHGSYCERHGQRARHAHTPRPKVDARLFGR